eukprot:6438616-Amphidinium_carterae.1
MVLARRLSRTCTKKVARGGDRATTELALFICAFCAARGGSSTELDLEYCASLWPMPLCCKQWCRLRHCLLLILGEV